MNHFWNFEPRRPRHQATETAAPVLVRPEGDNGAWSQGELVDISRQGIRISNCPCYPIDARLEIQIPLAAEWVDAELHGTVRWVDADADEQRETESDTQVAVLAIQCDDAIEWELLGELILNGALRSK